MPKINILTDNKTIEVDSGTCMIDLVEKHDTSILFGCQDGACGACLIKIVEGAENLSEPESSEKELLESMAGEANERLACMCKVHGDVTIEVSE